MDNNEKAFESYTGTEVFQILLDGSSSRAVLESGCTRLDTFSGSDGSRILHPVPRQNLFH